MNIQSKTDLIQFLFKNDNWKQHKGEIKKFSILHVIISPRGVNKNENFMIESVSIFLPLSKYPGPRTPHTFFHDIWSSGFFSVFWNTFFYSGLLKQDKIELGVFQRGIHFFLVN